MIFVHIIRGLYAVIYGITFSVSSASGSLHLQSLDISLNCLIHSNKFGVIRSSKEGSGKSNAFDDSVIFTLRKRSLHLEGGCCWAAMNSFCSALGVRAVKIKIVIYQ
ncbi:hypothetical protein ENBRE01_1483 [Enteropsectra breve]|nr:hypothetical protein ENBRE01_1483 [Enteropsectra breve]